MALVHLHIFGGGEFILRSHGNYLGNRAPVEPNSLRGGAGWLACFVQRSGERDGGGLPFISNKRVLSFIPPFDFNF